jgi:hypothetical protein
MPRHAGLRDSQDPCQLGHVQAFGREQPEDPETRVIAQQAEDIGGIHIYESTLVDI